MSIKHDFCSLKFLQTIYENINLFLPNNKITYNQIRTLLKLKIIYNNSIIFQDIREKFKNLNINSRHPVDGELKKKDQKY